MTWELIAKLGWVYAAIGWIWLFVNWARSGIVRQQKLRELRVRCWYCHELGDWVVLPTGWSMKLDEREKVWTCVCPSCQEKS